MKKFLAELVKRLTSRKFLLTVGTGFILVANQQYNELVVLILGYLGIEGGADVVERYKSASQIDLNKVDVKQVADLYNEAVDTGEIEPGHMPAQ